MVCSVSGSLELNRGDCRAEVAWCTQDSVSGGNEQLGGIKSWKCEEAPVTMKPGPGWQIPT